MNTGQMMIGIAALTLVIFTILNFNRGSLSTQDNLIYNKQFIIATTVAQSFLDEISGKAFDEEIVNGSSIISAADFSSNLASEPSEAYPNFDDIDDYNNFTIVDSIPHMGEFSVEIKVEYMTDNFIPTMSKSYNKNVTIRVSSPTFFNYLTEKTDTLEISSLFSQWKML